MAQVDFSILGDLPNTYRQAELHGNRQRTLADLGRGASVADVSRALFQAGDIQGGLSLANLANAQGQQEWTRTYQGQMLDLAKDKAQRERMPAGFRPGPDNSMTFVPGGPADPAYKRQVTDRQNAPAGYKWVDPNDPSAGLEAIPGGPGEKITAEVAARLGLAKSFLGQLEKYKDREGKEQSGIRDRVKAGEATGPIDGPAAALNLGKAGELKRMISSGAEALLRNLTGAGMNMDEARKYVQRYEPEWNDNAGTLLSKVDQLERELKTVMETVGKGRGGFSASAPAAPAAPAAPQRPSPRPTIVNPTTGQTMVLSPDGKSWVQQ